MRRPLVLILFGALPAAAEPPDPGRLLARSTAPLSTAESLLEAGEGEAVAAFAEGLSARQTDLSNKLHALLEDAAGNPAGALQALENVAREDAWTMEEKKRLRALTARELESSEHRSDHFVLVLPKRDAFLAEHALPALESAYDKASSFPGGLSSSTVHAQVLPDAESFALAARLSPDVVERGRSVSACRGGRLTLLSPRAVPGGFHWLDALCGALHRMILRRLSGGAIPLWLEEGLAGRQEGAWRREGDFVPPPPDVNRLAQAVMGDPGAAVISLSRVEAGFSSRVKEEVLTSRVEAVDAADHLVKTFGDAKASALVQAFGRMPRGEAFQRVLGVSEEDVESSWRRSLGQRAWTLARGAVGRWASMSGKEPAPGPEALPFVKAGDALSAKGLWSAAAEQYRKALNAEPDSGPLLLRAAKAFLALEDRVGAEESLKAAVLKNPFYLPPFVELGKILYDDGRYDEAQQVLQEGLEIQPFHPRLHETLGYISMDVGDIASARRSFQIALQLDPANTELKTVLRNLPRGNH